MICYRCAGEICIEVGGMEGEERICSYPCGFACWSAFWVCRKLLQGLEDGIKQRVGGEVWRGNLQMGLERGRRVAAHDLL